MITIPAFIKAFNGKTQDQMGLVVTTVITCFEDRSYEFEVKSPPASVLLKQAAQLAKASGQPNREKVATINSEQVKEIAQIKLPDLHTNDIESAMRMVAGTARSMGIVAQ